MAIEWIERTGRRNSFLPAVTVTTYKYQMILSTELCRRIPDYYGCRLGVDPEKKRLFIKLCALDASAYNVVTDGKAARISSKEFFQKSGLAELIGVPGRLRCPAAYDSSTKMITVRLDEGC